NPGRLLPTIRSRCRRITLRPLAANVMEDLLRRYRPDLGAAEARMLQDLAEGSIGRALEFAAAGGLDLERMLRRLLEHLPELDIAALHAFADRFNRPDTETAWRIMQELLLQNLSRMIARTARGEAPPQAGEGWVGVDRRGLDRWGEVWEKLT